MNKSTSLKELAPVSKKTIVRSKYQCIFIRIFWIICKIFAGAVLLYTMAGVVPSLRTTLPSFYKIVDAILALLEWICKFDLDMLRAIGITL